MNYEEDHGLTETEEGESITKILNFNCILNERTIIEIEEVENMPGPFSSKNIIGMNRIGYSS